MESIPKCEYFKTGYHDDDLVEKCKRCELARPVKFKRCDAVYRQKHPPKVKPAEQIKRRSKKKGRQKSELETCPEIDRDTTDPFSSRGNFLIYSRAIAHKDDPQKAIFLKYIWDTWHYYKGEGRLIARKYFYRAQDQIKFDTGLSAYHQTQAFEYYKEKRLMGKRRKKKTDVYRFWIDPKAIRKYVKKASVEYETEIDKRRSGIASIKNLMHDSKGNRVKTNKMSKSEILIFDKQQQTREEFANQLKKLWIKNIGETKFSSQDQKSFFKAAGMICDFHNVNKSKFDFRRFGKMPHYYFSHFAPLIFKMWDHENKLHKNMHPGWLTQLFVYKSGFPRYLKSMGWME